MPPPTLDDHPPPMTLVFPFNKWFLNRGVPTLLVYKTRIPSH